MENYSLPKGTYYVSNSQYSGLSQTAKYTGNVKMSEIARRKPVQRKK
jgi:hypothetical protein